MARFGNGIIRRPSLALPLLVVGGFIIPGCAGKRVQAERAEVKEVETPSKFDPTRKGAQAERTEVKRVLTPPKYDPTRKRAMERKPQIIATDSTAFRLRKTKSTLASEGGSEATEAAILAALYWLTRHQHPDGNWSCAGFTEQCAKGTCTNRHAGPGGDAGLGMQGFDVGVTALTMLAFQGSNHTHRSGQYSAFVAAQAKAVGWVLEQQELSPTAPESKRGTFGEFDDTESGVYNHVYATLALTELMRMTDDPTLKTPVTEAIQWILRAQNPGFGWKYGYQDASNDTSVTGIMAACLREVRPLVESGAIALDLDRIDKSLAGASHWIDRVTSVGSGVTGYEAPGDPGSALDVYGSTYPYAKLRLRSMTALGTWHRILSGQKRSDAVKRGTHLLMNALPEWRLPRGKLKSTINMYYWFYGTNALYQYGGSNWKTWNAAMQPALLESQRQGDIAGDEDGSWDPVGEWGPAGGRVCATALGALTLQVYYRQPRVK